MKKIFNLIIINLLIVIAIVLIINFYFLTNYKNIISQEKEFDRYYIYHLDKFYQKFHADTFYNLEEDYVAVLGDSYAAGDGDAWTSRKYNFSSLHFLKKLTNENFLNFGVAGSGTFVQVKEYLIVQNMLKKFPHKIKSKPKKIFFFFYEGNDIKDNVNTKFIFNEDETFSLKRILKIYFPIIDMFKNVFMDRFIHYYLHFKKKKDSNNQDKHTHKIIKIPSHIFDLNIEKIDQGLFYFFKNILYLKSEANVPIEIFYIPSPATVLDVDYLIENYKISEYNKLLNDLNSKKIIERIELFAFKNNIKFSNLTKEFKSSKSQINFYGKGDSNHLSEYGYEMLAKFIYKTYESNR